MNAQPYELAFVFGFLLLGTVVVLAVLWQVLATYRARVSLAREDQYRALVEATQRERQETNRQLGELSAALNETKERLARIEDVLRQVE